MYYSRGGNYEAFAKAIKPKDADKKHVYLIGGGLASLSAAAFLIRDGQVPGKNITILEASDIVGGALDGIKKKAGLVARGGRELESNSECL
jgi:oleate hydratase